MQALLICPHADETAVLTVILQKAGFSVRSMQSLSPSTTSWPEQPQDFILISSQVEDEGFLKRIRQIRLHTSVPIMLICDPVTESHMVELLEAGIDFLITRPYGVRYLRAQITSLIRRTAGTSFFHLPKLSQRDVVLDPSNRTVKVGSKDPVHLTHLEFRLLHTLITHPGQVIPSENIVEYVWGYSGEGNRELVRGLVQRLRSKMEPDPREPKYIQNELGVGYFFVGG
ncbi:MAG: response regulator transcription factor [Anaerolineales bacterium]